MRLYLLPLEVACRDYFLLEVAGGLVLEVFREGERWVLSRVLD
jgi:hypothetical protein